MRHLLFGLFAATLMLAPPTVTVTPLNPVTSPTSRASAGGAMLISDAGVETFFVFGGSNGVGPLNDFPTYAPSGNSWLTANMPFAREHHGMAWDPVHQLMVIVGGDDDGGQSNPLLLWSASAGMRSILSPGINYPSPRVDPKLVWVPTLGQFVYVGGLTGGVSASYLELWTLDLADGGATWVNSSFGKNGIFGPGPRGAICATYDPDHDQLIGFGGQVASPGGLPPTAVGETWAYAFDSGFWITYDAGANVPSPRAACAAVWEPRLHQMVIYGGRGGGSVSNDVWTFDPVLSKWTNQTSAQPIPKRSDAVAVWSPSQKGMLVFGGTTTGSPGAPLNDISRVRINNAPTVDAGPTVSSPEQVFVTLNGSATDPEDALTLQWVQTAGPAVTLAASNTVSANFLAPQVTSPVTLHFVLHASDGIVNSDAGVDVLIQNDINEVPTVSATAPPAVDAGATVSVTALAADPNGDQVGVLWSQASGPPVTFANPAAASTTFVAPYSPGPASLDLFVIATDSLGGKSIASHVIVFVNPFDAGTPDAGQPDAGQPDAGQPDAGQPDAGQPDAGQPDAGQTTPDAGQTMPDAGLTTPDAGLTTPDAGTTTTDAGSSAVDAGVPAVDAGVPAVDAGPRAPDAGAVDGGTNETRNLVVSFGCSQAPASMGWATLLALALLRFKRPVARPVKTTRSRR